MSCLFRMECIVVGVVGVWLWFSLSRDKVQLRLRDKIRSDLMEVDWPVSLKL